MEAFKGKPSSAIQPCCLAGGSKGRGEKMDLALRALCMEVVSGDVDSEEFASLLIETGVNIDSFEWEIANKLLKQMDIINSLSKKYGYTLH